MGKNYLENKIRREMEKLRKQRNQRDAKIQR